KEALRLALAASGSTYASAGGLNNHWGAPLSLARLPREADFGVFELGMNHSGEIARLARLVQPHIAVITTGEPAHLAFFPSVEAALFGSVLRFRLPVPGRHWVINALAVLAATAAAGADARRGADALAGFEPPPGRGRRCELAWRGGSLTLIDESYNASPAA